MPMIPLGLKETKEIDFRDPFKDFILEHYSEDAEQYEDAIADFMDTRQVDYKKKKFKKFFPTYKFFLGHEDTSARFDRNSPSVQVLQPTVLRGKEVLPSGQVPGNLLRVVRLLNR